MISRQVQIRNRLGLHARAAARFVQTAGQFKARVWLVRDGRAMDGKSILGILLLAAAQGTHLDVAAEGEDADAAVGTLCQLVEDRFGEDS